MLLWLLQNTVLAGLLAVGVAVVCRLGRPNPAVRHALWLLVLVRLLMPPGLHWPWAIPDPLDRPAPAVVAAVGVPSDLPLAGVGETEMFLAVVEPAGGPDLADEPATSLVPHVPPRWPTWLAQAALAVWGIGAAIVFFRHLRKVQRLRRWLQSGGPAPEVLMQRVQELAGKLKIRAPRVLAVPGLASPLVGGLPRPVLLWPDGLERRLPPEGVRAVLAHELAHLRRRDHWVRWLELVAGCVMWWNPLFALVRRKIRQYAEQACDAWVVDLLPKARRAYAEALLTVCETVSRVAEPAPALGVGGDDRRDFQRRLTMILRDPVACRPTRRTLVAVGLLALLAVPGWTLGQHPADPPAPTAGGDHPVLVDPINAKMDSIWLDLLVDSDALLAQTPGDARETKLRELEEKIQALLKEIQALKKEKETAPLVKARVALWQQRDAAAKQEEMARAVEAGVRALAQAEARDRAETDASRVRAEAVRALAEKAVQGYQKKADDTSSQEKERAAADQKRHAEYMSQFYHELTLKARLIPTPAGNREVTLSRATYTLPAAKAGALEAFLKEHLKASVVETTRAGESLTVTTTPEAQKAIDQLVDLITGRAMPVRVRLKTPAPEKPK